MLRPSPSPSPAPTRRGRRFRPAVEAVEGRMMLASGLGAATAPVAAEAGPTPAPAASPAAAVADLTGADIEGIMPFAIPYVLIGSPPKAPKAPPKKASARQVASYKAAEKTYDAKKAKYDAAVTKARELYDQRAQALATYLNGPEARVTYQINTPARQAAFLGQIAQESGNLNLFTELASGAEYQGRKDLQNTQPGDGVRYKGRGPIQLTGRINYAAAGKALGLDLINNPGLAATTDVGIRIAGWFWNKTRAPLRDPSVPGRNVDLQTDPVTKKSLVVGHHKNAKGKIVNDYKNFTLNQLADRNDTYDVTWGINGGVNGLANRTKVTGVALKVLKDLAKAAQQVGVSALPPFRGSWSGPYRAVSVSAQSPVFAPGSIYATYSGTITVAIDGLTRTPNNPSNPSTDLIETVTSATVTMTNLDGQTIAFRATTPPDFEIGRYNFEYFGADNLLPELILSGTSTVDTSTGPVQDTVTIQGNWEAGPTGAIQGKALDLSSIELNVWGPDVPNWTQAGAFLDGGWQNPSSTDRLSVSA